MATFVLSKRDNLLGDPCESINSKRAIYSTSTENHIAKASRMNIKLPILIYLIRVLHEINWRNDAGQLNDDPKMNKKLQRRQNSTTNNCTTLKRRPELKKMPHVITVKFSPC